MAKSNKVNKPSNNNNALLSLPVTASPRGLATVAQKLTIVLNKSVTVEAQGKSWLKLVGLEKGDLDSLMESAPMVKAETEALTRWIKGKDGSIMSYCMGPAMGTDILASKGITIDPEIRVVEVDLALYMGNEAQRKADRAQKQAEKITRPKKVNTTEALTQMLGILTEMKSDLDATKAELAALKAKPAKTRV